MDSVSVKTYVPAKTYEGIVELVLVGDGSRGFFSSPREKISVFVGQGVREDRHQGVSRLADVRERDLIKFGIPKGIEIANARMFSAVSLAENAAIATALGIPGFDAGDFGENLALSGIDSFSTLPPGTKIYFKSANGRETRTAILIISGPNVPCQVLSDAVAGKYRDDMTLFQQISRHLVDAAQDRRGVVGSVFCSGFIKCGDRALVHVPDQRIYQPDSV